MTWFRPFPDLEFGQLNKTGLSTYEFSVSLLKPYLRDVLVWSVFSAVNPLGFWPLLIDGPVGWRCSVFSHHQYCVLTDNWRCINSEFEWDSMWKVWAARWQISPNLHQFLEFPMFKPKLKWLPLYSNGNAVQSWRQLSVDKSSVSIKFSELQPNNIFRSL